mgnify:CR=1 FL=1
MDRCRGDSRVKGQDVHHIKLKPSSDGTKLRLTLGAGSADLSANDIDDLIRDLERDHVGPIAILQDLQGPKIRIGALKAGPVMIKAGDTLEFRLDREPGDHTSVALPHREVFENMMPGHRLLIDDGKLLLEGVACDKERIKARIKVGRVSSG